MEKITIKDVAQLADVSIATVSRVIHGQDNVSPVYAERVRAAMNQLNWRPNLAAQSLRSNKNRTIGVILPNTVDPFFGSIADSIIRNCTEHSFNVMPRITQNGTVYDEVSKFRQLAEAGVDGVIYCSISTPDIETFDKYFSGIPVVVCSRHDLMPGRPHVFFDHIKGGYLAARHLIEMGHRKIAIMVGVFGDKFHSAEELDAYIENPVLAGPYSGIDKYIGARKAFEEYSIPFDPGLIEFIDLGNAYTSGYHAMQKLLSRTTDIDAVFCSNDMSANGAVHMLLQQKIAVPDDISVIGYDNGIMSTCTQPRLSTIVQDTDLLGKECVECLKKLFSNEPCSDVEIDVRLIIRQSSCRRQLREE